MDQEPQAGMHSSRGGASQLLLYLRALGLVSAVAVAARARHAGSWRHREGLGTVELSCARPSCFFVLACCGEEPWPLLAAGIYSRGRREEEHQLGGGGRLASAEGKNNQDAKVRAVARVWKRNDMDDSAAVCTSPAPPPRGPGEASGRHAPRGRHPHPRVGIESRTPITVHTHTRRRPALDARRADDDASMRSSTILHTTRCCTLRFLALCALSLAL